MPRALVTGASSGIGLAVARALAASGYSLTVVARGVDTLEREIAGFAGDGHVALQADLSTRDGIDRTAQRLVDDKHDVLVNNAGYTIYGGAEAIPADEQLRLITLNVDAVVALSHAFLAGAQVGDALMNVASVAGMTALPGAAAYAGSKAFVIRFSESLWFEQRKRGVYVVALCPGATATNFYVAAGAASSSFPKSMLQTAAQVADEALHALATRRSPVVICGARNRALMFASRFASRKRIIETVGRFSPRRD